MGIKIVECIVQFVKNITSLCNKVVDASDPVKFAEGVNTLNRQIDDTYVKMRELIMNDGTMSSSEKLEKLEKLANSQKAAQYSCEEAIKENREHLAKIVAEVFAALATCGISCIPKVVKGHKKVCVVAPNDILIEGDIPVDCIDEEIYLIDDIVDSDDANT